jgi:hypothetical protein
MSTGIEITEGFPPDDGHTHAWVDLGALGDVDADGNTVHLWLCEVGGERTEIDPT